MRRMTARAPGVAALLLSLSVMLAGCGQKGPLYLPEDGAAEPTTDKTPAAERE